MATANAAKRVGLLHVTWPFGFFCRHLVSLLIGHWRPVPVISSLFKADVWLVFLILVADRLRELGSTTVARGELGQN